MGCVLIVPFTVNPVFVFFLLSLSYNVFISIISYLPFCSKITQNKMIYGAFESGAFGSAQKSKYFSVRFLITELS